jgi:hypothetical protein
MRNYIPWFRNEGEVIAAFGEAKLVKCSNGKYELRGGSKGDQLAAREWISLFMHEAVAYEKAGGILQS